MPIEDEVMVVDEIARASTRPTPIPFGKYLLRFDNYIWKPVMVGNGDGQMFVGEFTVREILYGSWNLAVGDKCVWVKKISRNNILADLEESKLLAFMRAIDASGSDKPLSDFYGKEVYCIATNVKTKMRFSILNHLWTSDRQVAINALLEIEDAPRSPQRAQPAEPRDETPQVKLFGPRILDVD